MKVALITGANGALGVGISKLLSQEPDIHLILVCRSIQKGETVKKELIRNGLAKDTQITLMSCDLSITGSVFDLASQIKRQFQKLDYLFLNAGLLPVDRLNIAQGMINLIKDPAYVARTGGDFLQQKVGLKTDEGLGFTFACNTFGHYILLKELIPLLKKSGDSRVIWCSSTTAKEKSFFDPSDVQCSKPYESSKRACELISMEMYDRLREEGIYSFITSPGILFSGITQGAANAYIFLLALYIFRLLCISGVNISGENAATSALFVAKQNPKHLASNILYHSEINIFGTKWTEKIELEYDGQDREIAKNLVAHLDDLYTHFRGKHLDPSRNLENKQDKK